MSINIELTIADQQALNKIKEAKENGYEELDLSELKISAVPEEISILAKSLKKLSLARCRRLQSLTNLRTLINLEELNLSYVSEVISFQVLRYLSKLNKLSIQGNEHTSIIGDVNSCLNLETLKISFEGNLKSLNEISNLTNLTTLKLEDCYQLEKISGIDNFKLLEKLKISSCDKILDLAGIEFLSNLKNISFTTNNSRTTNIDSIGELNNLVSLTIIGHNTKDLDFIKNISSLEIVNLYNCFQLENVDAITNFDKLEELIIEHCPEIKNINLNSHFPKLKNLEISIDKNTTPLSLSTLTSLVSLKSLTLCDNRLTHIDGFENLTNLNSLTLASNNLTDIKPIKKLNNLNYLSLYSTLSDYNISFIENLTNLNTLKINYPPNQTKEIDVKKLLNLKNLSFNQKIINLRSLKNIEKLTISNFDNIGDIAFLPKLFMLNISDCQSLINLKPINKPCNIKELNIDGCDNFESTDGIEHFTTLENFSTFDCEKIKKLEKLEQLPNLKDVFCFSFQRCQIDMSWHTARALLFDRPYFNIMANLSIEHIPFELTSPMEQSKIEDWYFEVENIGYSTPSSLKVMLLGNGRIGKTQLARRLREEEFDPSIPSTHGIQLSKFHDLKNKVDIQTWDFGGQDVYLGTHSLFIDNRALYLLLWTPNSENNNLVNCEKIKIRNRPLSYWLAYLKSLSGNNSNVIVCQSQCDDPENDQHAPIPHPHPIKQLREVAISTKVNGGLDSFSPTFSRAVKQQLKRNGEVWLPNSWLNVENDLIAISNQTTIEYECFKELCHKHNVSTPETLATYLHQAGKVFYRKNCFDNRIILDQAWALQGVYLLLEREDALPNLMKMGGKFDIATIERLLWKDQDQCSDKHLFIEMMVQCGVCFEITNGYYLSPDALPQKLDKQEEIEQIWQGVEPNYHVRLNYEFLHDATMRYLLCQIGDKAKIAACYWRYGCCFYDSQHKSKVIFECAVLDDTSKKQPAHLDNYGQPGFIDIQVHGSSSKLIEHLVESIREINHLGSKAHIEWLKGSPNETRGNENLMHEEQTQPFGDIGLATTAPNKASAVYFTYAWGNNDADPKQAVSDRIFDLLQNEQNIEVFRDKDTMGLGDSIEEFERKIGRSAFVLMIISEKSLYDSPHCMNELRLIYEHSQQQRDDFVARVIPVIMQDAKIDSVKDRLKVVRHWQTEKAELDDLVKAVGAEAAGSETAEQLRIMTSFINSIANTLHWLADLVIERREELQAETAVELVKKRISESQ
ncbi:COR domain-containing protein [Vibrio coralliirubri]|uniref:COR domain-containing protein n=1 Tax=Vibrio coralliirubri TaxID=1516159 RepID=UPI002FD26B57